MGHWGVASFSSCFATFNAKSQKLICGPFNNFPPYSHGLSVKFCHFQSFQSLSAIFNHFQYFLSLSIIDLSLSIIDLSLSIIFTFQEDVSGEKLTMKKWWIFGADLFHGLRRVFHGFIRDVNGEKHLVIRWSFSRLAFHGYPLSNFLSILGNEKSARSVSAWSSRKLSLFGLFFRSWNLSKTQDLIDNWKVTKKTLKFSSGFSHFEFLFGAFPGPLGPSIEW